MGTKKSAGVTLEMNLRDPSYISHEEHNSGDL